MRALITLAVLLLPTSCVSGTVRRVNFERGIDQARKSTGCYVFLPATGEITLMTYETCGLIKAGGR